MAVPISLKAIKPYLERANELQSKDPVVAYHCRLYGLRALRGAAMPAAERPPKKPPKTATKGAWVLAS